MDAKSQLKSFPPGPPTNIRFMVVGTTALMSVLLYLDRFCISFAEVFIKEDLGLSDKQIGFMLGAFFWTYALGQVPAGWLTDRFGSRIMLATFVLLWSVFTGMTGLAIGFAMLMLLRFGFGFSQAGAYPTGANIVSKWVPFQWRGTASSVVSTGGRVGGFLALYATGFVIVWLTPASTPAHLSSEDCLDRPRLCRELAG
ncbi:MAG: MFS transporter, partial [Pirellulaceae bacterium]|nr:MFS transporter [Pirellulaceae bacterium]